jgi:DNA-binding NtrC family response regulator
MIESAHTSAARPRLLLVDDDQHVLRAFEREFRRVYDVCTCTSGPAALEVLAGREVEVLITDFSMPVMSGIELLEKVLARHPAVARLMMTAYADLPEVMALKQRRLVSAVLIKPWNRAEVEGAVEHAVKLAGMQRAVARLRAQVGPPLR